MARTKFVSTTDPLLETFTWWSMNNFNVILQIMCPILICTQLLDTLDSILSGNWEGHIIMRIFVNYVGQT